MREKLSPAEPVNDGKQTPMKGHPIFKAMHGSAMCCRGCMEKWECAEESVAFAGEVAVGDREAMRKHPRR